MLGKVISVDTRWHASFNYSLTVVLCIAIRYCFFFREICTLARKTVWFIALSILGFA